MSDEPNSLTLSYCEVLRDQVAAEELENARRMTLPPITFDVFLSGAGVPDRCIEGVTIGSYLTGFELKGKLFREFHDFQIPHPGRQILRTGQDAFQIPDEDQLNDWITHVEGYGITLYALAPMKGQIGEDAVLSGHLSWVTSVCQTSKGVLVSGGQDGSIIVWCPPNWNMFNGCDKTHAVYADGGLENRKSVPWRMPVSHRGEVSCLCSVRDDHVASGGEDGTLCIWSTEKLKRLKLLVGHTAAITHARAFGTGRLLSCSKDGSIRTWDVNTSQTLQVLGQPKNPVLAIMTLSEREGFEGVTGFATGSAAGEIEIWDIVGDKCKEEIVCVHHVAAQGGGDTGEACGHSGRILLMERLIILTLLNSHSQILNP